MKLSRLGNYLKLNDLRNRDLKYNKNDVKGISIKKIFIETKANLRNVSLRPYKVIKPKFFAYVTVTSRNGDKVSIAFNDSSEDYIVSSSYVSFYVKDEEKLMPEFLYIYFNRPEFDRIARFNSWGSARETFSWDDLCDLEIHIPPIEIQRKFVKVYKALKENAKCYEAGLEDLEMLSHGYIELLRGKYPDVKLKEFTKERNEKNRTDVRNVIGISTQGFIKPKTTPSRNLRNYNVFYKDDFVYNISRINIGSIGLYRGDEIAVCSPIYKVFYVSDKNRVLPEYLNLWLTRQEFYRYTEFMSIASVRNNFSYDLMQEVEIPVPELEIQKAIVDVYSLYEKRSGIRTELENLMYDICPVLIKGATEESKGVI